MLSQNASLLLHTHLYMYTQLTHTHSHPSRSLSVSPSLTGLWLLCREPTREEMRVLSAAFLRVAPAGSGVMNA